VGLLEVSPQYLVSAAADMTLRIWSPTTGACLATLTGHQAAITCFHHDSHLNRIVSGSDGGVKVWELSATGNGDAGIHAAASTTGPGLLFTQGPNGPQPVNGRFVRDLVSSTQGVWRVRMDERRLVTALQREGGRTWFEVLDFGEDIVPGSRVEGPGDVEWDEAMASATDGEDDGFGEVDMDGFEVEVDEGGDEIIVIEEDGEGDFVENSIPDAQQQQQPQYVISRQHETTETGSHQSRSTHLASASHSLSSARAALEGVSSQRSLIAAALQRLGATSGNLPSDYRRGLFESRISATTSSVGSTISSELPLTSSSLTLSRSGSGGSGGSRLTFTERVRNEGGAEGGHGSTSGGQVRIGIRGPGVRLFRQRASAGSTSTTASPSSNFFTFGSNTSNNNNNTLASNNNVTSSNSTSTADSTSSSGPFLSSFSAAASSSSSSMPSRNQTIVSSTGSLESSGESQGAAISGSVDVSGSGEPTDSQGDSTMD
jgi:hypothetical protein